MRLCPIANAAANGSGLPYLADLLKLRRITLRECQRINDDSMVFLKELQQLRDISFTGVTNVGQADTGWAVEIAWSSDQHETRLDEEYCGGITDAGLAHLCEMPKLESLSLAKTRVTDAGLENLSQLHELRRLDLRACEDLWY